MSNHGAGVESTAFDVTAPPHSRSQILARYRVAEPPWPDLDLRLRFVLGRRLLTGLLGTLPSPRTVRSPQPRIKGRVAVHMYFVTSPKSARGIAFREPRIAAGRVIKIAGGTRPAIRGQLTRLRYARLLGRGKATHARTAARVRVRAHGRFRARWIPPRTGRYELWATYRSQRHRLFGDATCPRIFRVVAR